MVKEELHTIVDLFERSCRQFPENVYLWEKQAGKYHSTTYQKAKEEVLAVAGGFLSVGLEKGDRVALLSQGCNDWVFGELGALYAGGVNVPLSIKLTPSDLVFRINHSGARYLMVSEYYVDVIRKIESELPAIQCVFVMQGTCPEGEKYLPFEHLKHLGRTWNSSHAEELSKRIQAIVADDLANISYTSGTTAEPKGIMLTHGNYVCNVLQSDSLIQIPTYFRILLFLPWDHSFAHTVGIYSFMYNGASIASVDFGKSPMEYLRNIPINMKEIKPHMLLSVPALAKNFRKNIETAIEQKGSWTHLLYRFGLKVGYIFHGSGNHQKKGFRCLMWPLIFLLDVLLFRKIRKTFGGNLRFFVGGGALLDKELQRYYRALGIPMLQGYGLSEASPVISSNCPDYYRFGSSGKIVCPLELKICDERGEELPQGVSGEIVIRGGNVMKGYWRNERSTAEVIREGWLYTGDMGFINEQGLLYVLGRFKSLLIASDGEKYSPEGIEEAIVDMSPYLDHCILYNNQSAYTTALLVPNRSACLAYIQKKQVTPGTIESCKLLLDKIQRELMKFRKGGVCEGLFPERWLPAVVAILPEELSERNGTINSTTKVVRHRVYEIYRAELDYLYTPEGKEIRNVRNTQHIKQLMGFVNAKI